MTLTVPNSNCWNLLQCAAVQMPINTQAVKCGSGADAVKRKTRWFLLPWHLHIYLHGAANTQKPLIGFFSNLMSGRNRLLFMQFMRLFTASVQCTQQHIKAPFTRLWRGYSLTLCWHCSSCLSPSLFQKKKTRACVSWDTRKGRNHLEMNIMCYFTYLSVLSFIIIFSNADWFDISLLQILCRWTGWRMDVRQNRVGKTTLCVSVTIWRTSLCWWWDMRIHCFSYNK